MKREGMREYRDEDRLDRKFARFIADWWRASARRFDIQILWPACKREAMERHPVDALAYAKAAFAVHAFHDPAWLALGEAEIRAQIDRLT